MFSRKQHQTKIDIISSPYRTRGDLKMLRHLGHRDIISAVTLPLTPTSAKSYRDFFQWFIDDAKRCAQYRINLYPVIGIPPNEKMDPKVLDETIVYIEEFVRAHKVFGIGEIGMGRGSKEEYNILKRQLKLAGKYNLPVIIEAPTREKVAYTSIILKEIKKANVSKVIFDHCDKETLQLVMRSNDNNIKAAITVGKTTIDPEDAVRIYRNYSYDNRICLDSGLGLNETSLFGLIKTIELFEETFDSDLINKLSYKNYLDVFPSISEELRKEL